MATTITKPDIETASAVTGSGLPAWPQEPAGDPDPVHFSFAQTSGQKPSQLDALQALLAFSALHEQIRRRKALAASIITFESASAPSEFEATELFVLDEVLHLVAERAVAITGADGLAIALAENNQIVLRAAAGNIRPDVGTRIDRDSAFSGACFRTAQIINCDDTETDSRVNLDACRKMGARSMVAVPLCGRKRVIGVLEAFSAWPFAFNEIDVRNLSLLAELILGALKPEDEDRFAQSAQIAATTLDLPKPQAPTAEPVKASGTVTAETSKTPATRIEPPKPESPKLSTVVTATPPPPASAAVPAASVAPPLSPVIRPTVSAPHAPTPKVGPTDSPKSSVIPAAVFPAIAVVDSLKPAAPARSPEPQANAPASSIVPATKPESMTEPKPANSAAEGAVTETISPPTVTFGSQPEESNRPWLLVMLVGTVIAAAFIAGVWWKLKNAQIGGAMVQNPAIVQPSIPAADRKPMVPSSTSDANDNSARDESENAPASPQELSKFPRVTGVRHWSSGDSSTVVLDLEDQVQYEPGHLSNPERFYFDLRDTQLAPELEGKSFDGDALLSRIRVAQPVSGMTRIVLEARPSAVLSAPQVSLERDPYRLVIQVSKTGATPKGSVNLFPAAPETEKAKLAIVIPPPTKEDLQLRARVSKMRIVVDAGHGGWDLGTVGRRGLLEKDLVLEISQRLGKLLESRLGAEVIYTRQDDNYIPLDDRAVIANQAQADLFVSVHANYSDLPSARGVETYYTNFFSAPGSKDLPANATPKEIAMRSNPKNVAAPTLSASALHDRIEQSRRLAATVQRSLYGTLSVQNPGLRDRGIKEAGFVVLTESAMPGILAEVSFVSSPTDEQKLRSDGYREQIAEALYKGIARYASTSRGVKIATAAK